MSQMQIGSNNRR